MLCAGKGEEHSNAPCCVAAWWRVEPIQTWSVTLQSLQALEKISFEHPAAVLRAGGLLAVLSYLDFFSTGVQVSLSYSLPHLKSWLKAL